MDHPKPSDVRYKIMLVGDSGVGKTNLIQRYIDNVFDENSVLTLGVDYKIKVIGVSGKTIALEIWDTQTKQERFLTTSGSVYRGSNAIIIVFDLTDEESFRDVNSWVTEVERYAEQDCLLLLAGNKADSELRRVVDRSVAEERAENLGMKYIEVSALSGLNVEEMFECISRDLISRTPEGDANTRIGEDVIRVTSTARNASEERKCCNIC